MMADVSNFEMVFVLNDDVRTASRVTAMEHKATISVLVSPAVCAMNHELSVSNIV